MKKIASFLKEIYKWTVAGWPLRTPKRIKEIHDICRACVHFDKGGGNIEGYDRCKICSCNLHPTSTKMNKIAFATTKCPLKNPKWGMGIVSIGHKPDQDVPS